VKFKDDVIAVIGLGGTGSYILDFLVKTPVREIKSFDLDPYYVHNAFRSPGKLDDSELCKQKVDVYKSRYENFRHGLSFIPKFIDATCEDDFDNVTFAFVCVDKGSSRAGIFDLLISKGIPFIDVGMDLSRKEIGLGGMARVTYFSVSDAVKLRDASLAQLVDGQNDMYKTNIQISELNSVNACLAVIKFKQIRGFYFEEVASSHMLFNISDMKICGD
jgi:tRNA A37 threonylcarbamoyladenosine dehydratase